MYGYFIDPEATAYQAEIAQNSRSFATSTLNAELKRTEEVRLWMHDVLTWMTMAPHKSGCQCALEDWTSIGIRVRGSLRAVADYLNCQMLDEVVGTPLFFIRENEARDVAREIIHWPPLRGFLEEVADEMQDYVIEYEAAHERMIADNEAGKF